MGSEQRQRKEWAFLGQHPIRVRLGAGNGANNKVAHFTIRLRFITGRAPQRTTKFLGWTLFWAKEG